MRFEGYIAEESIIPETLKRIFELVKMDMKRMSFDQFKKKAEAEWIKTSMLLSPEDKERILKIAGFKASMFGESTVINESAKHWWDLIKTEAFPTLAFLPAFQVWLELDKMLRGTGGDTKVAMIYAAIWLVLISGKYVKGWMEWKKSNPEEHAKERAEGKGGII